jgi:hypothetical protein
MSALTILIADHHEDLLDILKRTTGSDNYALLHAKDEEEASVLLDWLNSKIERATSDPQMPVGGT